MKSLYTVVLPITPEIRLNLPVGANVVSLELVPFDCFEFTVDGDPASDELREIRFRVVRTGDKYPPLPEGVVMKHFATFQRRALFGLWRRPALHIFREFVVPQASVEQQVEDIVTTVLKLSTKDAVRAVERMQSSDPRIIQETLERLLKRDTRLAVRNAVKARLKSFVEKKLTK